MRPAHSTMAAWRKPNVCECGGYMHLTLVYDTYVLICKVCGSSKGSARSLVAETHGAKTA